MTVIVDMIKDQAPDIYETPDLTDEASTVPVSYWLSQFQSTLSDNTDTNNPHGLRGG